ncbi:MAG: metallophosphoesterase [Phycisphaerae bacterium]|nr:metallophosphoesterase [Phycisphaerae bacterium]
MTQNDENNRALLDSAAAFPAKKDSAAPSKKKISRRKFIKWASATGVAALAGGAVIDAFFIEPHWFKVTYPVFRIPNLPPAWDGVRIAHITDIHVGALSNLDDARDIVNMANALNPDIVVMTGDYVSRAAAITRALVEVIRDLRAKVAKFAVLGNHDYWTNSAAMINLFEETGVKMLTNRSHVLRRKGQPLCFAGVDDLMAGRPDLYRALTGVDKQIPRILLCHNPDFAEMMPKNPRVDMMLCGHTHGGQIKIPLIGPLVLPITHKKYAEGLVQGPRCPVFISRGLGMVKFPVRFNCRPELPLITLRRK